jgi:hypothetical protein
VHIRLASAVLAGALSVVVAPQAVIPLSAAATSGPTTAWQGGAFHLDPLGVVSRSDIVLGRPNLDPIASMPLGNGALGVAAWAANGFTAQLNRSDTMPDRKSPGQLNIPGLSVISHAADFKARLNLTDGVLEESGGGMSMRAWVSTAKDELIVDVSGASAKVAQSATINLWSGRNPAAAAAGAVGTLAETWVDKGQAGAGGQTFGSLAAITAGGENVTAHVTGPRQVQVTFTPHADGTFRVIVGSPGWTGGDATATAANLLGKDASTSAGLLLATQRLWWYRFWNNSGLVEMNSADGSAAYTENLRTLYLFEEAASLRRGSYPGNQAGDADMFDWSQDRQTWTPSEYWLWNMRAEISANMSSGNYQLNQPIFDMYINDLSAIEAWTKQQMGGLPGACVPEVMRFNGNGGDPSPGANSGCSEPGSPNWNALDITSGPELSVYMWQQYQGTGDLAFLRKAFPFMEATAQFLLAYQHVGADGLLHSNANAHETQWAVQDPTTNIAADQALFPIIAAAAALVDDAPSDDPLLAQFAQALTELPPYPRTDTATHQKLFNPNYTQAETDAADASGNDMIAISYEPAAQRRNGENIELEPLWPWNQVTDQNAAMYALEQRSYANRPNKGGNDWSFDAVDAARLGLASQVESNLISLTAGHQVYPNGFADLGSSVGYQPYMEQSAGVATAVDEALVQAYDGIIRFAPAWPSDWNASGTVYIQHHDKVDVQVQNGELVTAAIESTTTGTLSVKNPWPGQQVEVVDGKHPDEVVVSPTSDSLISVRVKPAHSYLVQRVSSTTADVQFAPVTGTAPTSDRHLKNVQLGLDPAGPSTTAVVGTVLGVTNAGYGVTQVDDPSSAGGTTTAGDVGGLSARTAGAGGSSGSNDMYFDIAASVARTSSYDARFRVSYYDSGSGAIALQYDNGPSDPNHAAGTITLTDSHTWKTATIDATGAYFGDLSGPGADFRLHGSLPITVHSVGVSITGPAVPSGVQFPPAPVITTPKNGSTAKLSSSIVGTSEPDGAVTVTDGSTTLCTATADDAGAWSCAPSGGLPAGRQTISAAVMDTTGLTSPSSASVTFTASDLPPGTAVVGSVVGATNFAYGMAEDETPSPGFDGPTTASVIGGLTARTSTNSNIYFNIDDSIAHAGYYTATFTVSYFDQGNGSFQVQYDDGSSDPYRSANPSIPLTNTSTWKTATATTSNAYFGGQQHSGADFRLRNGGGQVTVHSVSVTISGDGVANTSAFPPQPAITSPTSAATVSSTPAVAGAAEPDSSVTVKSDGSAVCTATASDTGAWTCTPSVALASGPHTLTATSTDPTANTATSAAVPVTVQ